MATTKLKEINITMKFSDMDDDDPYYSFHFDEEGIKFTDEEFDDFDSVINYHAEQIQQYLYSTHVKDKEAS